MTMGEPVPAGGPSRLLIIQTGQAPESVRQRHGDFDDWFRRGLGRHGFTPDVIRVDHDQALPRSLSLLAGAVITGSPAMVSERLDWSERTARWLASAHQAGLPLLGVCYGHQLLAHALGGRVGPNPRGRYMGTVELEWQAHGDPLLDCGSEDPRVHITHQEVVLDPPPGACVLARADHDPCHVLHFGRRSWGVQFHPEFDEAIMSGYIAVRADALEAEGQDSAALLAAVRPAPRGPELLDRFARFCLESREHRHAVSA
jgi:GMP synthase (glutamine-hydrolysing)